MDHFGIFEKILTAEAWQFLEIFFDVIFQKKRSNRWVKNIPKKGVKKEPKIDHFGIFEKILKILTVEGWQVLEIFFDVIFHFSKETKHRGVKNGPKKG